MEEVWKPIAGYEGSYSVSSHGRVRSERRVVTTAPGIGGRKMVSERILKAEIIQGYPRVVLSLDAKTRKFFVHVLVLEAFVGPRPDGMDACHNNGVRTDASLSNLRWDTRLNNMADRIRHGTMLWGERGPACKLTISQVREIRAATGPNRQIGERYGISKAQTRRIKVGKSWGNVA